MSTCRPPSSCVLQGDNGRLSLDPAKNCIGVAAMETLKLIGQPTCGISLTLHKVGGCIGGGPHHLRK